MKKRNQWILYTVILICMTVLLISNRASAANKKVTMTAGTSQNKYPAALVKAKKVTVKSSKKSVVKAQYKKSKSKKKRKIVLTAKKQGTAIITVKCKIKNRRTRTYKYKVTVKKRKKVTALDKAKEAFRIQNQYRKEKGVAALEWSDELYQFCLYRLKTSGYDAHKNLGRDTEAYFGDYIKFKNIKFGENMHSGYSNPKSAMKSWKNSPGHYKNLLTSSYVCGAIACYKNTWCAIFFNRDKNEIDNWESYHIKEINVKRYDSQKGIYLSDCAFGYYEADDKWGTLQAATISTTSGKAIYLEVGKTYIIYERKTPEGCEPAEKITITVTEDGVREVVLS